MAPSLSRPQRWNKAASTMRDQVEILRDLFNEKEELEDKIETLDGEMSDAVDELEVLKAADEPENETDAEKEHRLDAIKSKEGDISIIEEDREEARDRLDTVESEISDAISEYNGAMCEVADVKAEYEEWKDNLPENLQSSNLADKLETICSIETEEVDGESVDEFESPLDEIENADFPLGFGRD